MTCDPVYEKVFSVRSYEVDVAGQVRPTAILNYLQEAAGDHARLLGVAVRDLRPRGLTWVISRIRLQVFGTLRSREEVRVRTWPSRREGRFSCREFELLDTSGRQVALATSSWAVLDIGSRRPVLLDGHIPDYPLLQQRVIGDEFAPLPRMTSPEAELSFRVGRGDLDLNRHVNNVVYAGWGLETVPEEVAERCRLVELEISFRAEALYGETVLARCQKLSGEAEPVFCHQIVRGDGGTELTRLLSRWQPTEARE